MWMHFEVARRYPAEAAKNNLDRDAQILVTASKGGRVGKEESSSGLARTGHSFSL
jgi:hypothetical protein